MPTCIDNHGNESQCKAELCDWCPCSKLCVPEKYGFGCDAGCAELCNDVDECAARGCIFDPGEKKCYDVDVDTNVDLRAICGQWNDNSGECTRNGCLHCPCSKRCLAPQDSLKCDIGCYQYCNQIDECSSHGCGYQDGKCFQWQDWQIARLFRHAVNLCHNGPTFINGINYLPTDYTKIIPNTNDPASYCSCNPSVVNKHPDKILYECVYESPDMDILIPVREEGNYEIGLHFAEIYRQYGRTTTMSLNGVIIKRSFEYDSYGKAGTRITITKSFSINCNITEVTVLGQTRPIVNKMLALNLLFHIPSNPSLMGHATLSAYELRKL
ncbi:unnamed protein product [Orchesella dallaii]|uniref:Malectin-like domain-containing protein n=1 Tax=Orchesella dallaii TaxID=48710 RepID=A0ABP1PKX4_9HEXA